MRLRSEVIGVLNLFSTSPGSLKSDDRMVAQALADIATIGILQERALRDGRLVSAQLESALASRIVIEQAKGLVAERINVTMDAAFDLLRTYARKQNRPMRKVALEMIDGIISTDVLTQSEHNRSRG
jgi:GAF domain-containing protein